ncbi:capsular biosynthesis protein CpsH [Halobiforma lacisalsi AJ5]|uniref:Capsular biosynthesis protein CpsH n=1 Tax=Natronobacterium lacisalsi AJ5 TaxID=358396 RepID=M0LEX3_NATLA|nr:bacteriorhodopsin [Halobiforma lacisalsi]APW96577.1 capsular biosynthesis protein CpsH [Halobiforma lacisalsi AJ5]EMA32142.1 halorhodopsin [Halobiforma lacisalsi AJ5]
MTQPEVYESIQNDQALNASFWVNIALAGLVTLLFVYMGRNLEDPRAKLIWVATLMVPLVSISSYTGLASGLTVSFLEMPAGHALAGDEVLTMWGRYLTWTFSTPMILLALGMLAGTNLTKLFTAITADIAMCVTGLAAAMTTSSYALRWFWYFISCTFFLVVLYVLLAEWPRDAEAAGTDEIFGLLRNLTVVLWLGYPIFWALGAEGLAVLDVAITSWAYSILDIGAKYIFAYLLLNWIATNERVIAQQPAGIGTGVEPEPGTGTPAED